MQVNGSADESLGSLKPVGEGDDSLRSHRLTFTPKEECSHGNGWYHTVRFLWWEKRFLACFDCASLVPMSGWKFRP